MQLDYFQLVDRVEEIDTEAGLISCRATVPTQSTIFEGHFPGNPIMPGVLLIECMAQASGYLLLASTGFTRMPFLAEVKEAKLRSFVLPGTPLLATVEREHVGSGYAVTRGRIERLEEDGSPGKKVAEAEIRFRTLPFPSPDLRAMMKQFAERIGLDVARFESAAN